MKKKYIWGLAIVLIIILLIVNFPVYRLIYLRGFSGWFSQREMLKAMYIGSPWDLLQAQEVMKLADEAFSDVQHTRAENEERYGLLSYYATPTDSYKDAAFNEHSLSLWSAHLGREEGWIWVYYTSETYNHDGVLVRGSSKVPALWKVEKGDNGTWTVTQIKEHP